MDTRLPPRQPLTRTRVAAAMLLLLLVPIVVRAAPAPPRAWWWHQPSIQKSLGLTATQVGALHRIYMQSLPSRRALRRQLDTLEQRFAVVMRVGTFDPAATGALVERLTDARRRSNVARTMLLVRMMEVLEPGQRQQLARIVSRDGL